MLLQSMALMMGTHYEPNKTLKTMCILMAQQFPALLTEYARDAIDNTTKRNHHTTPGFSTEMHRTPGEATPQLMELKAMPATGQEKDKKEVRKSFQTARGGTIIQLINASCLTLETAAHTARENAPPKNQMTEQGVRKIIQTIKGSTLEGATGFCTEQRNEVNKDIKNFVTHTWPEGSPEDNTRLRTCINEGMSAGNWAWTDHPCPACKGTWNTNKQWPLVGIKKHLRGGCNRNTATPNNQTYTGATHQGTQPSTNGQQTHPDTQQLGYNPEWRPQHRGRGHPRGTIRQTTTHTTRARDTYNGRGNSNGRDAYNNKGNQRHHSSRGRANYIPIHNHHTTTRGNNTAARGSNRITAHNDLTRYGEGLLQHPTTNNNN